MAKPRGATPQCRHSTAPLLAIMPTRAKQSPRLAEQQPCPAVARPLPTAQCPVHRTCHSLNGRSGSNRAHPRSAHSRRRPGMHHCRCRRTGEPWNGRWIPALPRAGRVTPTAFELCPQHGQESGGEAAGARDAAPAGRTGVRASAATSRLCSELRFPPRPRSLRTGFTTLRSRPGGTRTLQFPSLALPAACSTSSRKARES